MLWMIRKGKKQWDFLNISGSVFHGILFLAFFSWPTPSISQVEMVPVDHKVYSLLEDLSVKGIIDYNNSNIPLSRGAVGAYLKQLIGKREHLTLTENRILDDLLVEFSHDVGTDTGRSFNLLEDLPGGFGDIFDGKRQKYLMSYADSNFSLFLDGVGALSFMNYSSLSFPPTHLMLGEIGPRLRGSFYNALGYYIQITGGQSLSGSAYARSVAARSNPILAESSKFVREGFIDGFTGYVRLEGFNRNLALTVGRESFEMGNGYIDKIFVSDNIPPFDFVRMDMDYKFFRYGFFIGNLKGDSLGMPITSKLFIAHRLDVEMSRYFRFGLFESMIISNSPLSLTFLNPVSYITSVDITTDVKAAGQDMNNGLIGLDCEAKPFRDVAIQCSFLIDDMNLSTLFKHDESNDANKFGYQAGIFYAQPFGLKDLTAILEYTRIDPYVYSHRTNESNYTNWGICIGAPLPPNSDQVALRLDYYLTSQITMGFVYRHQRSGEGFLDANGIPTLEDTGIITRNFGGDVNRGDLDTKYYNTFLQGLRINREILTLSSRIEPVRQYYFDVDYTLQYIENLFSSKTYIDQIFYVTAATDF